MLNTKYQINIKKNMLNAFNKKKYILEDENTNFEPFDYRIKQIEIIRKNRLIQLEKQKQKAFKDLEQSQKELGENRKETIQKALYYALLEPVIEQKFLFLDVNVKGLTRWVDDIKLIRQNIGQTHTEHYKYIEDYLTKNRLLEQVKKECQEMLVKTEKLALIENLWNENGGL